MPRGKKICPSCKSIVGARASVCECGHKFLPAKKKKTKPFFAERREFVKRMLAGSKAENWQMEMHTATKVFDFLCKVKPPFIFKNSIKFFLTKDGREYLEKKYKEFNYKPPEKASFVLPPSFAPINLCNPEPNPPPKT